MSISSGHHQVMEALQTRRRAHLVAMVFKEGRELQTCCSRYHLDHTHCLLNRKSTVEWGSFRTIDCILIEGGGLVVKEKKRRKPRSKQEGFKEAVVLAGCRGYDD